MITPINYIKKSPKTKQREFFCIIKEAFFNGKLIRRTYSRLHYDYMPHDMTKLRADNKQELLLLMKEYGEIPGVWSYENWLGKTVVRVSTGDDWSKKIKDDDYFVYEYKVYAEKEKSTITAGDIKKLSADEYAQWCKDNIIPCI